MTTIEIDFDVYKELTARRESEEFTYNDVLRKLLDLPATSRSRGHRSSSPAPNDWISKGVRFPVGTEFRAQYKGRVYHGSVEAGALVVDGKRYSSPSPAAGEITGNSVNGWTFWECRFPGEVSWRMIKSLR
jgi:hypothetical protein